MAQTTPDALCRVCQAELYLEPLLSFHDMPATAQYLPVQSALASDAGIDLELQQCSGCGLVQLSREPVHYYREVIRAAACSREMRDFRVEQFSRFVTRFNLAGKRVLEAGCGSGEYLALMVETGADPFGIEYSESAVTAAKRAGLAVDRDFVNSPAHVIPNAPFAAFFTLNFLEHLPRPNAYLAGIANNLENNAVGLVEVPNFDMILRQRLFSEFMTDHLSYFTRQTLETMLNINGFDVVECAPVWHDYILSAVVQKRQRLDIAGFSAHQEQIVREIHGFIDRFGDCNVAVWGAGHQSLAMISLAGMAGRIRYVVDSAPFKQGKFTPATHVPIVAPEALVTDPVRAIVIMAASYSDEVARTVTGKFGGCLETAVLRDSGLEYLP